MIRYPRDLALELHRVLADDAAAHVADPDMGVPPPSQLPPGELLESVMECVFFGSLLREESGLGPIAVVVAASGVETLVQGDRPWMVTQWQPKALTPENLRKMSAASAPGEGYLIAALLDGHPVISGLAIPPRSPIWALREDFVLITGLDPGEIIVELGRRESLRYVGGKIIATPPPPFWRHEEDFRSFHAIRNAVLGGKNAIQVDDLLYRMAHAVAQNGHGGLLAICADAEDGRTLLVGDTVALRPPLPLGATFRQAYEASEQATNLLNQRLDGSGVSRVEDSQPTDEEKHATRLHQRRTAEIEQLLGQLGRLSALDGALLVSPEMDLLAFGCKLNLSDDPPLLKKVVEYPLKTEPYNLGSHGTRHKAAASFASQKPGRIAICASQDGPVSVFFCLGSELVVWPMRIVAPWVSL
jgi:hypothetical protein